MKKYFFIALLLIPVILYGQDSTGSLAFKKNRPGKKPTIFYQPDLSYRIWQQFNLIKEANSGNSLAQHELGLRYLLGEDQPPDTVKAAFWIKKAALQKLPSAAYNYGILLFNGWGTEWDPFGAYKNFLIAVNDGMPQAEYIVGLLYTDNLVVKRDWKRAYYFIKKSADKDYKPALEILDEIKKRLPADFDTTSRKIPPTDNFEEKSPGLLFIDFDRPVTNLNAETSDSVLFEDLLFSGNMKFDDIVVRKNGDIEINFDEKDLPVINEAAGWGCPEALSLTGWLFEKGIQYSQNKITAASFYIRGAKLDSYRSTLRLYELIKNEEFINEIKSAALRNEPEAMFVWFGLYDFGLDNSIAEKDAVKLLSGSAEMNYAPAQIEFAQIKYSGKYIPKNTSEAISIWENISGDNNNEAKVRIAATVIYGETEGDLKTAVETIIQANDYGSVLAQVVLGYLYEKNYLSSHNTGEDIKYYRNAAQRGNRFAISQLERMYDEVRPSDPEFKIK